MVTSEVNLRQIAVKLSRLTWEQRWPCPVFACYILEFTLQLRKRTQKSQGIRKVSVGHDSMCQNGRFVCNQDIVDPELSALGDPVQYSVKVDVCRAVLCLSASPCTRL